MSSLTVSTADASSPNQSNFHQPTIVSASAAAFTVGQAGTFTVSSTGTPTPSLSASGGLPPAVDFTDNGDGTATIAGTPSSGSQGSYGIELTAANGHPPDAKQAFTLSVDLAPAITSGAAASLVVGTDGSFTIDTTGYPPPALAATGALPGGVSLTDNGDGSGSLSGTPALGSGGLYDLALRASNGTPPDASQALTLTVSEAPTFVSSPNATMTVDRASSFTVRADGFPAPSLTIGSGLPPELTFTDNRDGTATIAGTPAAASLGAHDLALTGSNEIGAPVTQQLTVFVTDRLAPAITIESPVAGRRYRHGQRLQAKFAATAASGIASIRATVADGHRLDTRRAGRKTFSVTATSDAGVTATETIVYTVLEPSNEFTVSRIRFGADGTGRCEVRIPGPGVIDVMVTAWKDNVARAASVLQPAPHRFVVSRARVRARHSGAVHVVARADRRGDRLMAHHAYPVTLRLWVTFTPTDGRRRSEGFYGLHLLAPDGWRDAAG